MKQERFVFVSFVCTIGLLCAGCNQSGYQLVPVSGKVTLDGKPLAGALVNLQPTGQTENPGPGSNGITDADGVFRVKTIDDEPGAVVGRHRIAIWSNPHQEARAKDTDDQPVIERVPKRYNLFSELSLEVTGEGTDSANFDLTTP